jgi:hypothetical protein
VRLPQLGQWEPVIIEWIDANGGAPGWGKLRHQDREIHGVISCGQVESQSNERVTLVLTRDTTTKNVHGTMTIPVVAIVKLTRLS